MDCGLVESQHEPLFEIPVIQPKDTWFGPNAQQGEICYATSVDGRTDLNLLTHVLFVQLRRSIFIIPVIINYALIV